MPGCFAGQIHETEFTREEIEQAVRGSLLLAMEIELGLGSRSRRWERRGREGAASGNELSRAEVRDVILQARDLRARRITILCGESVGCGPLAETIRFIGSQGLDLELWSSSAGITPDLARELFEERVRVVLRMDSLDPNPQGMAAGVEGPPELVQQALQRLREAGYPSAEAVLGVATVISRHNLGEIPSLWRWLREQGIVPYLGLGGPQRSADEEGGAPLDPAELRELASRIAEMERGRSGEARDPRLPLWRNGCMRHRFSCLVCWQGDVMPCVGLEIPIGNIRERTLRDIIKDSEVLEDLRDHAHTIKGPCASCPDADACYGCRGVAYRWTGDYLASDPSCWRNADRQDEIARLPFPAEELIPQQRPMRLIDELMRVGERSGEVSATVSDDMPFVRGNGALDEIALFEMMAQSVAALDGFKRWGRSGSAPRGYLVGARNLEILEPARAGDTLHVSLHKEARFGNFGILEGTVSRNGAVLARGEIKIWHEGADAPQAAGRGE
jgi:radical SAM protein with 4Fe4S-binding SPASM domain